MSLTRWEQQTLLRLGVDASAPMTAANAVYSELIEYLSEPSPSDAVRALRELCSIDYIVLLNKLNKSGRFYIAKVYVPRKIFGLKLPFGHMYYRISSQGYNTARLVRVPGSGWVLPPARKKRA